MIEQYVAGVVSYDPNIHRWRLMRQHAGKSAQYDKINCWKPLLNIQRTDTSFNDETL
jgi:hypothetical protein